MAEADFYGFKLPPVEYEDTTQPVAGKDYPSIGSLRLQARIAVDGRGKTETIKAMLSFADANMPPLPGEKRRPVRKAAAKKTTKKAAAGK